MKNFREVLSSAALFEPRATDTSNLDLGRRAYVAVPDWTIEIPDVSDLLGAVLFELVELRALPTNRVLP